MNELREKINALRAYYGAGPTTMTDEQIVAGREVYGAKKDVDMVIVDELNTHAAKHCYATDYTHGHCRYSVNRGWTEDTKFYVPTMRHGTLTSEQVREAAKSNSRKYESPVDDGVWLTEYDWQAIADELNAELDSGTCEAIRDKSNTIVCSKCGNCGGEFDGPLLCKRCGELADMEFGDMCSECYWYEGEGNDE